MEMRKIDNLMIIAGHINTPFSKWIETLGTRSTRNKTSIKHSSQNSRINILLKCTRNIPQDEPFVRPYQVSINLKGLKSYKLCSCSQQNKTSNQQQIKIWGKQKYLEINTLLKENENITYQNLWDTVKACSQGNLEL